MIEGKQNTSKYIKTHMFYNSCRSCVFNAGQCRANTPQQLANSLARGPNGMARGQMHSCTRPKWLCTEKHFHGFAPKTYPRARGPNAHAPRKYHRVWHVPGMCQHVSGMYQACVGHVLGMCWACMGMGQACCGHAPGMCWACARHVHVPGMCQACAVNQK